MIVICSEDLEFGGEERNLPNYRKKTKNGKEKLKQMIL